MATWSSSRRVIAARFVSRTGKEAAFFVGIWGKAAYELDGTASQVALVMGGLSVAALIGASVGGWLTDRFGPKRVLLWSEIAFVPAVLSALLANDFATLTMAASLIGLTTAPSTTAIASFPPFITDDEDKLARLNARLETAAMAALIAGTAIGAALAATISIDAVFILDAATSIVATAIIIGVRLRKPTPSDVDEGGWTRMVEGFRVAMIRRRLRFYVLMSGALWLTFGLFTALEPLFYRDVLGEGPETIGWVNSILGIGLVAGTVLVGRLPARSRSARTVVLLLGLNGLAALVYIGTTLLWVVVIGALLWGAVIGAFMPLVRTMQHVNSPPAVVGRVMGVVGVASEIGHLAPLLLAPVLADAFGVQPVLIGAGVVIIAVASASGRHAGYLDRTRSVEVPPVIEPVAEDRIGPM